MSVVLVVKVSEGLVLAGDSAATLSGRMRDPSGQESQGILQTFYTAQKVLQVGDDFPIGVLTWGVPYIGVRTTESLVREWEHDNHWQSIDDFHKNHPERKFSVKDCAEGLLAHLKGFFHDEYGEESEEVPGLGMVVAGYSEGDFFPEIWRFVVPEDSEVHNQRPDRDGKPDFGASWFGITEPIVRLHFGRDELVPKLISEKFSIPEKDVHDALLPLQYTVPFAQMPLQDAIEYARYLMSVVIGRFKFVIGPELVGGAIDLAAITQRDFMWISRKSWKL